MSAGSGGGVESGRPPQWRAGLGADALSGVYREVFAAVVAGAVPVTVQEVARALGRDVGRANEVEKVRHRLYVLEWVRFLAHTRLS